MTRTQLDRTRRPGRREGEGLSTDDTGCTVLHVDMDAFYASVELIDRPRLRGLPVIVGGGERGVVLSATYEARRFGVHSAMPMTRARRLCPGAHVIGPQHARYAEVSAGVMEIFRSITPYVEPLSLDEAFLDVAGAVRRLGPPAAIARLIRHRVETEQGITCSVGVAGSKFVAKLASSRCKPDGLLVVPTAEVLAYLHPLPVSALWGVGEKTAAQLDRLGLRTVADIANLPRETLCRALGPSTGAHLHELAWGRDHRSVEREVVERSVGAEETFERDVDDPEVVLRELLRLAERTARRLRSAQMVGRTVTLKVRFGDFTTITRSRTLPGSTDVAQEIHRAAVALWDGLRLERARIRLVGIRVENLDEAAGHTRQLRIGERAVGRREAERAADAAVRRFGPQSVGPASLLGNSRPRRPEPPAGPGSRST